MSAGEREQVAPAPAAAPSRAPAGPLARRACVILVAAAALFFCYWRQSQAAPVSSDGAGNILQAWDMLHGNLLLRHWWVSDVSFYTTELPQYMLIEAVLGLAPWVVHVAAAITYTLLMLLAALLARGADPPRPPREGIARGYATGRAGWARALLAGGLMLAPQLSATSIVLLSPDHTGTAVLLLVTWLLIDRTWPCPPAETALPGREGDGPGSARDREVFVPGGHRARTWYVPVLVCLLLTQAMVADSVVLLTGIIPLMLVAAVRAYPGLLRRAKRPGRPGRPGGPAPPDPRPGEATVSPPGGAPPPRPSLADFPARGWYELGLAGAAAVAGIAGSFAPRLIAAVGGYRQSSVGTATDLGQLRHGAWVAVQAFLELFGASFFSPRQPPQAVFVALHLAGAVTVACALVLAFRRFFRAEDLMVPVFAVAIALNVAAYMISTHAQNLLGAREIAAVLPLGAVLAGRLLGDHVLAGIRAAGRWLVPALIVLAAGYLAALGYGAAQAPVPPENQTLAGWLVAHRLTAGLASYWEANSTTVDSHGQVVVSAVVRDVHDRLVPYQWETDDANYDPAHHYANFVVTDGFAALPGMQLSAELTFGRPARIYHADGYTIMVWDTNLLAELAQPGPG